MPDRIAGAFARARDEGRAALMPYMMGGFPDPETAAGVADAYVDAGADLIELGVPFSDPLADGPVIHAAATRAIGAGATLESVLALCEGIADRVPVVPMCYANMALAQGEGFAAMLADAGAAGVIVPDLPLEEAGSLGDALAAAEIALVPLVAPTTPEERRKRICEAAHGFVYLVSDTRVTGERDELPPELADLVSSVKAAADVPVAVGFGIGRSQQAATVGRIADGVIIGSRLVRAVAEAASADQAASGAREFLRECREAMSSPRGVG
jgi:tryptophan synthase alpha chain